MKRRGRNGLTRNQSQLDADIRCRDTFREYASSYEEVELILEDIREFFVRKFRVGTLAHDEVGHRTLVSLQWVQAELKLNNDGRTP